MSDIVISVENLSKRYLVGHRFHERYTALRDVIAREARNFARKAVDAFRGRQIVQGDEIEEFWALQSVSFEVHRGEIIGIIGNNGAGKSTLLKILSRITEPTAGRVRLRGRVASLLEVGTGFHPELTGRENIFLNGAILGMSRREIRSKFDQIVAFADVEKFLDTPVKHYSSGMYVRLAFSVAAHLEPDILVVDEVLSVGDADFQKKCLGKMDEVSRLNGRTVLLVSHNMAAVSSLCASSIWLDRGHIKNFGQTSQILREYLGQDASRLDRIIELDRCPRWAGSDHRLRLKSLEWLCKLPLRHGELARARVSFITTSPLENISVGIGFSSMDGRRLLTYETDFQEGYRVTLAKPGQYSCEVEIASLPLTPDVYSVDVGCRSGDLHSLDYVPGCVRAEVIAGPGTPGFILRKNGAVRLRSNWNWTHVT
jgi:lipopolysaccharide transport system ATP-binding protein